jgi:hypothetical protein
VATHVVFTTSAYVGITYECLLLESIPFTRKSLVSDRISSTQPKSDDRNENKNSSLTKQNSKGKFNRSVSFCSCRRRTLFWLASTAVTNVRANNTFRDSPRPLRVLPWGNTRHLLPCDTSDFHIQSVKSLQTTRVDRNLESQHRRPKPSRPKYRSALIKTTLVVTCAGT